MGIFTNYVAELGDKLSPKLEIMVVTYVDVGFFVDDPAVCCLKEFCVRTYTSHAT